MENELAQKVAEYINVLLLDTKLTQLSREEAYAGFESLLQENPESLGPILVQTYADAMAPNLFQRPSGMTHVQPNALHHRLANAIVADKSVTSDGYEALLISFLRTIGPWRDGLMRWREAHREQDVRHIEPKNGLLWADDLFLICVWQKSKTELLVSTHDQQTREAFEQALVKLEQARDTRQPKNQRLSLFHWWTPHAPDALPPALLDIGHLLWELVDSRLDAHELAVSKTQPHLVYGSQMYRHMPKVAGSLTWSLGSTARVSQVDTHQYIQAPMMAELIRSAVEGDNSTHHPHQVGLSLKRPIHGSEDEQLTLPFEVGETQLALSPMEAKAFVYLASHAPRRPGIVQENLQTIVEAFYPQDDPKNFSARCQELVETLHELRQIRLVLPDGTDLSIFDIRVATHPDQTYAEQPVHYGFTSNFLALMNETIPKAAPGSPLKMLNGRFLYNATAALGFSGNEAPLMRYYLTAAASWNDAWGYQPRMGRDTFPQDRLPIYTDIEWGLLTTSFSPAVVEYLSAKRAGAKNKDIPQARTRSGNLSDQRKDIRARLEALHERGLIELDKIQWVPRKPYRFRILPTSSYVDAYHESARLQGEAS